MWCISICCNSTRCNIAHYNSINCNSICCNSVRCSSIRCNSINCKVFVAVAMLAVVVFIIAIAFIARVSAVIGVPWYQHMVAFTSTPKLQDEAISVLLLGTMRDYQVRGMLEPHTTLSTTICFNETRNKVLA